MPPGIPHRPPLAMRLWLVQRFRRRPAQQQAEEHAEHHETLPPIGRLFGSTMSFEMLEQKFRSRVRMLLRHTWIVTILGTALLGGTLWAAIYYTTEETVMRVAVGPEGSADVQFVHVLDRILVKDRDRIDFELVPTDGPQQSARAMADGRADLAILPGTMGGAPDWPVVAILRQNVMALIVPTSAPPPAPPPPAKAEAKEKDQGKAAEQAKGKGKGKGKAKAQAQADDSDQDTAKPKTKTEAKADAKGEAKAKSKAKAKGDNDEDSDDSDDDTKGGAGKIKKVSDLVGRRIGIVSGNAATEELLAVVLKHYGVSPAKVTVSQIDPKNLSDAVKINQVDALFVAGAAAGAAITDVVAAATQNGKAPTFIEIDQADGIAKRNPAFDSVKIDAGTFGGNPPSPTEDFTSLKFDEYLVARRSFNHDSVAALAKRIYLSRLAIAAAMPGEIKIEAPSTDKDGDVSVHPGALAYLTDDQKTFFDKYGDDIFYGLLIFPVFGSAIAGVASYLRNDSRTRRLRLLQKVLDLVRKAHAAQTLDTLEQLQVDADDLVIAIIHQCESEEFDETVRMSFSFALDQLRFTIAARRTAILDRLNGTSSKAAAA